MSAPPVDIGGHGPFVVARLTGDIDIANVEDVRLHILEAIGNDAHGLIVDLSAVRYVDSAGVHMLFELVRRLESRRLGMALALPDESPVSTLLKITNLDEAMPVRGTVEECVEALRDDRSLY